MKHLADSFHQENRKFTFNIITSIRSDDVIVTSLDTTLSRTFSEKDTDDIHSNANTIRKLKRIVVILPININEVRRS